MRWFSNQCARCRKSICLLAADALIDAEKAEIESHLSNCPACRHYYDQIKGVAAPLANWETHFERSQPHEMAQIGWANAIQLVGERKPKHSFHPLWRELVFPFRWHLAGMSTLWLLIAVLNGDYSPASTTHAQAGPDHRQFLIALQENRRQLLEWMDSATNEPAVAPGSFVPKRRSEVSLPVAIA